MKLVAWIAIVVPDDEQRRGAFEAVRRDDEVGWAPAEWGEPMPVDPGEHTLMVTAPREATSVEGDRRGGGRRGKRR